MDTKEKIFRPAMQSLFLLIFCELIFWGCAVVLGILLYEDFFGIGFFMFVMAIATAVLLLVATVPKYRTLRISDKGFGIGRQIYNWERVSASCMGTDVRKVKVAAFLTVAEIKESFIVFNIETESGVRRFRFYNNIYKNSSKEILSLLFKHLTAGRKPAPDSADVEERSLVNNKLQDSGAYNKK